MSIAPGKCDNQGDSTDFGDNKELTPAMGKLSLNVKAIPYIPKQDGGSQSHLGNEPSEETGSEKNCSSENQNGHETEEGLRAQVAGLKQSLKQYEDMIGQYQVSEQTRKREVDSALITAREVVERERREKLDVLSDRKSREERFDQLSKAMTMLQTENEDLLKMKRQQDEKLTELTRLKTLIQENGFPNIEQFLMLQRQIDSLRDEFFAERKERERLQSQKDKMKRELEAAQSRIASLQEQVYKYREHIYYIQNKFKQSSPFRPLIHDTAINRPISASEACKLYGPNATQYINHGLTSPMNPVSPGAPTGDAKFSNRNEKKPISGGRQWQDNRMPQPMTPGDDGWRRSQQQPNRNNNGYYNNMHRMTSSNSAPSLAAMVSGADQTADAAFYEKQYGKPGFARRSRSSLTEDGKKDYGMPLSDWSKQNKQGKRFPSPLPSPTLLPSPGIELWSPQQPPGFQKGWPGGQDEIFRFPPSPLTTPTSKSSFEAWPSPSPLVADDKVFSPQTPSSTADENCLFPLPIPTSGSNGDANYIRFPPGNTLNNGKVYVCYNCGIHFDDNDAHKSHVETCGL